jgi:hypothetical protein
MLNLEREPRLFDVPTGEKPMSMMLESPQNSRRADARDRCGGRSRRRCTPVAGGPGQTLSVLAALGALAVPGVGVAAQLDPEDAMVQEFQSFCVDYYTPAQCTGAVRFILKTAGSQYFVQLQYEEAADGFLDLLATAVKGGEALKVSEATSGKLGN